ncbi:hypothetical protein [Micromonospora ureilytica]|uniref:hypothetical protein n=1 Tax=Micromonospora ureilytica TaxID=709868 RepID=UPI0040392451
MPNEVYLRGTEATAKGAFSYRVGMTMAEWLCWGNLGMSHSLHAESACPRGVDPDEWDVRRNKPDLVGRHSLIPHDWLVEAKAERRLSKAKLREGAAQLRLDGLVDGPHRRVLCGTSLEDRVFMTLDIDTRWPTRGALPSPDTNPMAGPDVENDDEALYQLARASMLIYLVLRQAEETAIVPVGAAADRRRPKTPDGFSGAVTLLDRDPSTLLVRERVRNDPSTARQLPRQSGIDMLTATVPGAGMTVGLSRRVYAACNALLANQRVLAERAEEEADEAAASDSLYQDLQPDTVFRTIIVQSQGAEPAPEAQWVPRAEARTEYERRAYNRFEQQARPNLMAATREAFESADARDWESVAYRTPQIAIAGPVGQLESATADTYLAIDPGLIV